MNTNYKGYAKQNKVAYQKDDEWVDTQRMVANHK